MLALTSPHPDPYQEISNCVFCPKLTIISMRDMDFVTMHDCHDDNAESRNAPCLLSFHPPHNHEQRQRTTLKTILFSH